MGTLAVASYFRIKRNGDGFKSPWSAYIQYFYVGFSIFVLVFIIIDKPFESLVGLSILLFGALTYLFSKKDYTDER
jgi:APA family basic amino acid/polyamine antiporter